MTSGFLRVLGCGACLLFAAAYPALPLAQTSAGCSVAGAIVSGRTPLPGVVVSLADANARAVDGTASGPDGLYSLKIPGPGTYTLKAEFVAFAPIAREIVVDAASCQQRVDLAMTLKSRAPQPGCAGGARWSAPATTTPGDARPGRGQPRRRPRAPTAAAAARAPADA